MKKALALICSLAIVMTALCGCNLFSKTAEKISFSESTIALQKGETHELKVTVSPEGASTAIEYSSSDPKVARVNDSTLTAVSAGSATITAKSPNGLTAECEVTVSKPELESITLSRSTISTAEGKTIKLDVEQTPTDADVKNFNWSSDDLSVAKVNSNGEVTAIGAGVAIITCQAADSNIKASCTVTVKSQNTTAPSSAQQSSKSDSSQTPPSQQNRPASTAGTQLFPYSSVEKLTNAQITATIYSRTDSPISDSFAQDGINEIYARNGYIFKTDSLNRYYRSQPWYVPNAGFSLSDLNSVENYNIKLLSNY